MNRRVFLLNHPLLFANRSTVIKPIVKQVNIDDVDMQNGGGYTVFKSKNNKLIMKTLCEDYVNVVNISNLITWQDPISNSTMKTLWRKSFILDADTM